jgi:hypothetical protein
MVMRHYIERIEVHRNQKVAEIGDQAHTLYLLQSGAFWYQCCMGLA